MLAEIAHVGFAQRRFPQKVARGLGEEDLPAMSGTRDACCTAGA